MHPFLYITKPLLSQAGALIYPKVFVSLGIQFIQWQRYIIIHILPTNWCFFRKELMKILREMILFVSSMR